MSVINGDCLEKLKNINSNSIDFCLIDPPYGIDKMNHEWDYDVIKESIKNDKKTPIKSLPVGMKFNPNDAKKVGELVYKTSLELLRVLKPGSYCVVFSQARSSHRIGVSLEDAGFEIRDQLIWDYGNGQCKAQGLQNFIKKNKSLSDDEKQKIILDLDGLKTPQLTPCFETMWLCQKPKEGGFLENYLNYGVGLVDFRQGVKKVKFEHKKPNKEERLLAFNHPTLKPLSLLEDIINTFSFENQIVLDCFGGSGSTAIACMNTNRKYYIIEKDNDWFLNIKKRIINHKH